MALMPVADALQRVLADARPLPAEAVPLDDALGRVLTEDVVALRTQPPAAVSAMDGYAVRASDVAQAPVTLKVIGEVAAGHPFPDESRPVKLRVFSPAASCQPVAIPWSSRSSRRAAGDSVTIQKPTAKGRNVRAQGIDFTRDRCCCAKDAG